jgi:phytoene dehydrogenase-like protein
VTSAEQDVFDIVFVGAGHNALVAAALLAKSGYSVLVLDRNDRAGGFVRTDEIAPGFLADRFSAAHPVFTTGPAYAALGDDLRKHGLEYVNTPFPTGVLMADGSTAVLPRDMDALMGEADRLAPGDGSQLARLFTEVEPYLGDLFGLFGQDLTAPTARASLSRLLLDNDLGGYTSFASSLLGTARNALRGLRSPALRSMLGSWPTHAGQGPDDAGSGLWSVLFPLTFLQGGMSMPRGGSGVLASALTALIQSHGGAVVTDTEVSEIRLENGRAVAVGTREGTTFRARGSVVASVNPDQLYLRLLPEASVPSRLRDQARGYRYGNGQVQINLALSHPPRWPDTRFANIGQPFVTDSLDGLALHVTQARGDYLPAYPTFSLSVPSAIDPSRAPAGSAVMRIQITDVPTRPREDAGHEIDVVEPTWTPDLTSRFAERVLDLADVRIPGLKDSIVASVVETPTTLSAYNPNAGPGDAYGGASDLAQNVLFRPLAAQPRHRTFVPNLYTVGASTWPGASVSGASGYIVAQQILGAESS